MMTVMTDEKDIATKTRELIEPLKDIGLAVVPYTRGPLGPYIFSMSLGQDAETIRVWTGSANLSVVDAQKRPKRQAVIRIKEDAHKVVQTISVGRWHADQSDISKMDFSGDFPITLPAGTKFAANPKTVKYARCSAQARNSIYISEDLIKRKAYPVEKAGYYRQVVDVTASVPTFDNSFLIGYDEIKCFIAQLPKHVNSVEEAYTALRPATVPSNALRQGEWFFVPIEDDELESVLLAAGELDETNINLHECDFKFHPKAAKDWDYRRYGRQVTHAPILKQVRRLEKDSSHHAIWILVDGKKYAWDEVKDTRASRHAPLVLEQWHRVERNAEVVVAPQTTANGQSRAQRWD